MNPDIFEALMLVCFGAAWPFSIYRMLKTKQSRGKSIHFLIVILVGYLFGILFEYYGQRNLVILLYILNAVMISVDIALTLKYRERTA